VPSPEKSGGGDTRHPCHLRTERQRLDPHRPLLRKATAPDDPTIKVDDEEEELKRGIAVKPFAPEQQAIERYHDQRDGIVPKTAPHDERDVRDAQNECDGFQQGHVTRSRRAALQGRSLSMD